MMHSLSSRSLSQDKVHASAPPPPSGGGNSSLSGSTVFGQGTSLAWGSKSVNSGIVYYEASGSDTFIGFTSTPVVQDANYNCFSLQWWTYGYSPGTYDLSNTSLFSNTTFNCYAGAIVGYAPSIYGCTVNFNTHTITYRINNVVQIVLTHLPAGISLVPCSSYGAVGWYFDKSQWTYNPENL